MSSQSKLPKTRARLSYSHKDDIFHQIIKRPFIYIIGIFVPLVLYFVFIGYPLIRVFILSLHQWDGVSNVMPFVGLDNYVELINDPNFKLALVNNAKWAILTILFPVVIGLLLAVLLNSNKVYFSNVFRAIFFLPTTMSLVGIGIMFALILNPSFGAINLALESIGMGSLAQDWLGNPDLALYSLIFVFSWGYIGIPLIMFYAGISEIPIEYYEAASLEGINPWQKLRYITLPMLKPVTTVVVMLTVINSLRAFDLVMVMTRGGPFRQTTVLGYYMYLQTFGNYNFGYGAAISVSILLISVVFAFFYIRNVASEAMYVS